VVVVLAGSALAYAAWTVSGSGQGSATASSAANLTFSAASPSSSLFPGGSSDVATTVNNPNPFPVHITSIGSDLGQGTAGFSVDGGHSGCNLGSLSLSSQTNGGSGWDVPANGSLAIDLTGGLSMSGAAVDACQGASFTVFLTATAASA
jgi:hypothetical protein